MIFAAPVPVVVETATPLSMAVNGNRAAYEHLLGKVSDSLIAEVYGVDRGGVSAARRKRGIAALTNDEAYWTKAGFKNYLASLEA